ncbi:hypothetical protein A2U01_0107349, partial [Trifolium medium]|nr:hypothetical protein [Trifolium medium]
ATRSSCCEGGLAFCLWRGAQLRLARRAVLGERAVSPSGVCATRS